jgi:fluoride exporter
MASQKLSRSAVLLTFSGGALGSLLRFTISEVNSTLVALWIVNILGALFVGFFAGHKWFKTESRRAFFSTGLAGGFTTMSAIAVLPLGSNFDATLDAISVGAMVAVGMAAYWLGLKIGSRMGDSWKR